MFFDKLTKNNNDAANAEKAIFVIVGLVVVGSLIARGISLDFLNQTPPLLPYTTELKQVDSIEKMTNVSHLPFYEPTNTFSAEAVAFGVFTQPYESFPRGAIIAVYQKNNWRAFQIEQYPNSSIEGLSSRISHANAKEIDINDESGLLLDLIPSGGTCIEPIDNRIGQCPVNTVLLVQKPGMVVAISTDKKQLTEGQLIEIGRSLSKQN